MSDRDNQELEELIKGLFSLSKKEPKKPGYERLQAILKRGLNELAWRDLLLLTANIITAMLAVLMTYARLLTRNR